MGSSTDEVKDFTRRRPEGELLHSVQPAGRRGQTSWSPTGSQAVPAPGQATRHPTLKSCIGYLRSRGLIAIYCGVGVYPQDGQMVRDAGGDGIRGLHHPCRHDDKAGASGRYASSRRGARRSVDEMLLRLVECPPGLTE